MTAPDNDLLKEGQQFEVKKDKLTGLTPGVFIRIKSIAPENYVVLESTGTGPDELDIPAEQMTDALDNGTVIPKEYDPIMHE